MLSFSVPPDGHRQTVLRNKPLFTVHFLPVSLHLLPGRSFLLRSRLKSGNARARNRTAGVPGKGVIPGTTRPSLGSCRYAGSGGSGRAEVMIIPEADYRPLPRTVHARKFTIFYPLPLAQPTLSSAPAGVYTEHPGIRYIPFPATPSPLPGPTIPALPVSAPPPSVPALRNALSIPRRPFRARAFPSDPYSPLAI